MHALPWTATLATLLPAAVAQADPGELAALAERYAAYAAKVVASARFVSGRTLDSVRAQELAPIAPFEHVLAPQLRFTVDEAARRVVCTVGGARAEAVATANLGCTLVRPDAPAEALQKRAAPGLADLRVDPASVDWPLGDRLPPQPRDTGIDRTAVVRAIDAAFAEPAKGPAIHTRAIVVVHRDELVAERYAAGCSADMPLPGWSMTKTWTHALLGRRVQQGKFDPLAPLPVAEWQAADDPRAQLTCGDLLAMRGGLRWNESYTSPDSDALRMLFGSSDHAAVYAQQPAVEPPGTVFCYASGATNLLCRVLRGTFASDLEYWAFPRLDLFLPLGMRSAVLETDPNGTFVGSSYGFASARDWARFGLLYAHDGVWAGQRLLPAGWIARAATAGKDGDGDFGEHLWLNADPDGDGPRQRQWPDVPADLLRCDGHEGQYVLIVPSLELVAVRLGCTKAGGFDVHGFTRALCAAVAR